MKTSQAFNSLLNILNISGGRDKTARITQYFCKFLANYLKQNYIDDPKAMTQITALILQLTRTSASLSNFRKILRFGGPISKQISINKRIALVAQNKVKGSDKQWQCIKIVQEIGASLYALTDHFLFFYNIGIFLKKNPEQKTKLQYYNDWLWMWDAVFGIIANLFKMAQVKNQIQDLTTQSLQNKSDSKIQLNLQQCESQISDLVIDTTRLVVDIPVIINGLNSELIGPQMGGLLGAISSAIGIYQLVKEDQNKI